MKTNDKSYPVADAMQVKPLMEQSHDKAEKYAHFLSSTAERMLALSEQLGKGGRELTADERELLRFAAMPLLRDSFKEMLIMFVAGENPINGPAFQDAIAVFEDLTKR